MIPGPDSQSPSHPRANDTLSQNCEWTTGLDPEAPERKIVQGRAHDGMPLRFESRVHRDALGEARTLDSRRSPVPHRLRELGSEVERIEH